MTLPAGKHTLKLVNSDSGAQSEVEIEIPVNGTVVKKLQL